MTLTIEATDGAEVWCRDCEQPATEMVETTEGRVYLCHDHALTLVWKISSPATRRESVKVVWA